MGEFACSMVSVVFHIKTYTILVNVLYSLIADGNPVRVLPEVFHDVFRVTKGQLAINHPSKYFNGRALVAIYIT